MGGEKLSNGLPRSTLGSVRRDKPSINTKIPEGGDIELVSSRSKGPHAVIGPTTAEGSPLKAEGKIQAPN